MPYKKHLLFEDPLEKNIKLWRYIDFTKFVSMLETKCLFFPKARILKTFDPWEGSWTKEDLKGIIGTEIELGKKYNEIVNYEYVEKKVDNWQTTFRNMLDMNFISCWHYNDVESAAMWRLYLKSNEGIVIQSDKNSFKEAYDKIINSVHCGKVRYINYENEAFMKEFPFINLILPFLHKRKIYEHEKEYRAIILIADGKPLDCKMNSNGLYVPIIIEKMIQKIIVAPQSTDWFLKLIESTCKKYSLKKEIRKSEVDDEPFDFDLEPYTTT